MAGPSEHAEIPAQGMPVSLRYLLGGSLSEGVAGAGAVAVAIIALADGGSFLLLSIATILVGSALMFEGASMAAKFTSLLQESSRGQLSSMELGAGMSGQLIGGMAVLTLGILSILGIAPVELTSIAAIIAGGSVLLGSGSTARMNAVKIERSGETEEARGLAHSAVSSAAGAQFFIGVGAIVLGILGTLYITPLNLASIAMLGVGFSVFVGGAALSGLSVMFRH
jgi:hypothetical protein